MSIKYQRKDGTSNEKWVNGKTLLNANNLNALAENLQEIIDWKDANAKKNTWWVNAIKPRYSADEVEAESLGTTSSAIARHNASGEAHKGFLAEAVHTHTLSQIVGFPTPSTNTGNQVIAYNSKNKTLEYKDLAPIAFTGSYNDMTNAPVVPTRVSELENDASYIKQDELTRTSTGAWNGSALGRGDSPTVFMTGFRPTYVRIMKISNKKSIKSSYYIDYRFAYSIVTREGKTYELKVNDIVFNFTDWGFTLADVTPVNDSGVYYNELNEPGYTYNFIAVGKGTVELPYVTNDDNGSIMYVADGEWKKVNIGKLSGIPEYTSDDINKTLLVSSAGGEEPVLAWKPWRVADGGSY